MKESVLTEKEQKTETTARNPVVVIMAITVVLILLLNIISAFIFY